MKKISLLEAVKIQHKIYSAKFEEYEKLSDFEFADCLKSMTDSDLARLNIEVPIVDDLDKKVLEAVGDGACSLNMESWHNDCGTVHCWAGWIVTIAGATELEKRFNNTALVATWIYEASTGKIAPDFYNTSNKEAYVEMKKRAGVL